MSVSIDAFIASKSCYADKITAIDALIEAMYLRITEVADGLGSTIDEYSMDDGQMKVRTSYRSVDAIYNGINALLKLQEFYRNKGLGSVVVLRDVRGLR